eukprot:TRINITY_DN402_c0_g1_i1.p1 TRINITY_DN402_c0_g1~~TRINITY_DN402_c0_g1_i1.p1  ORF type:complete len:700 (-),score=208.41 TRINITY_DN402_c0_g1_i1:138-2237(-)
MRVLTLTLFLLANALRCCSASTYGVDFTLVDTSTSPTASSQQAAATTCDCDLTQGKCDLNCCCDAECSATEKASLFDCCCEATCFENTESGPTYLIASEPYNLAVWRCCCQVGSATALASTVVRPVECVNAWAKEDAVQGLSTVCRSSAELKGYTSDPAWPLDCSNEYRTQNWYLRGLLCVEHSNAGAEYENTDAVVYYEDQSTATVVDGTVPGKAGFGGAAQSIETVPNYPQAGTSAVYAIGEPVNAAYVLDSAAVTGTAATGYMHMFLPSAGFDGTCDTQRPVLFGKDADSSCLHEVVTLSTECTAATAALSPTAFNSIDALAYGAYLHVAAAPSTTLGSSSGWIQAYLRAASGITSWTQYSQADTSSLFPALVQPTYTTGTLTCANVLRNLTYHITYGAATGVITSVNTSVELQSITALPNGDAVVPQQFSVRWYQDAGSPAAARVRSGSPGYIPGQPLMAGFSTTDGTASAYAQMVKGAMVPQAGESGVCSIYEQRPILYGVDMKTQCTVAVASAAELETYCNSVAASSLPTFLSYNFSAIAILGVSEPRYTANWTAVSEGSSLPTASYLSSVTTCSSLVTGITFDVVIADLGEQVSPQAAVLSVQVNYEVGSFVYNALQVQAGAQKFTHSVAVRFHKFDNGLYERMPSFTPVVTTVPNDIMHPFYPFGAAARTQHNAALGLLLLGSLWVAGNGW